MVEAGHQRKPKDLWIGDEEYYDMDVGWFYDEDVEHEEPSAHKKTSR